MRWSSAAHALGLKVIIDQVYSHTSDQHPWFQESRSSRDNPKADWYVWADAKPDGSPPNNWQSVFGGPAWTWDARRGQYYLHNFLPEQPDLNLHNPAVQDALLDVARFWLDRGVDGFRLDAINFAMHDPELRDNPPAPPGGKRTRPFDFQQHLYNQSHPDIVEVPRAAAAGDRQLRRSLHAGRGRRRPRARRDARLHRGRCAAEQRLRLRFPLRRATDARARRARRARTGRKQAGWPSWAFENHDAPRAVSRWATTEHRDAFARTKMLLLCALRGSIILYQGEELGLPQVDVPFEQLQDPEAIANWPHTLEPRRRADADAVGSGCGPNLGFSSGSRGFRSGEEHRRAGRRPRRSETAIRCSPSPGNCVALRKANPVLRTGRLELVEAGSQCLVFDRSDGRSKFRCSFNLSSEATPFRSAGKCLLATGDCTNETLGAYAAVIEELS